MMMYMYSISESDSVYVGTIKMKAIMLIFIRRHSSQSPRHRTAIQLVTGFDSKYYMFSQPISTLLVTFSYT